MGLRSKGPVDGKLLEKNYRERLKNYSPSKLEGMTEAKEASKPRKRRRNWKPPMNFFWNGSISKLDKRKFFFPF